MRVARGPRIRTLVAGALLGLVTAACAAGGPTNSQRQVPSQDRSARCQLTPDAVATATAKIALRNRAFGLAVTVQVGQAVAFENLDTTTHTVTEGTGGHAVDNSCARQRLPRGQTTAVTFHLPGDYPFTCTIHASMQTTVHVR
ncbi:MAG: plastocyanin/azurin family copper-binding protein [Chloroflexota bacterium]|nr:plastocyanin/azurin family copper-binding protein [Chloroflexota bacterium]